MGVAWESSWEYGEAELEAGNGGGASARTPVAPTCSWPGAAEGSYLTFVEHLSSESQVPQSQSWQTPAPAPPGSIYNNDENGGLRPGQKDADSPWGDVTEAYNYKDGRLGDMSLLTNSQSIRKRKHPWRDLFRRNKGKCHLHGVRGQQGQDICETTASTPDDLGP